MIRYLIAAVLALVSIPAVAQTQYNVVGATPAPTITVCAQDTLVLRKPMGRELLSDGSRDKSFSVWIDRQNGKGFTLDSATKIKLSGYVEGLGYVYAPLDAKSCNTGPLWGANIGGAEGADSDALRPSMYDMQGYVDYYGAKLIRYPFKDYRMTAARIAELKLLTDYANSKGVKVIRDSHTYRWDAPDKAIAFWTGFAKNFPDDGSVILDLVNEPKGFNDPVLTNDWRQWLRDSNLIIAGLRANGIKHPIALEYPQWSASFRFDKKEAATKACESAACAIDRDGGLKDPLNLTYINAHRYFDNGASGTSKKCTDKVSGLVQFAAQLRQRGLKAYITEIAFGSSYGVDPSCEAVGTEAIQAIKDNSDVILGVTWWGGGRYWPESYIFKIEPLKATRFTAPIPSYTKRIIPK